MKVKVKIPPRSHHKVVHKAPTAPDVDNDAPIDIEVPEEHEVEVDVPDANGDIREALQRLVSLAGSAGPNQQLHDAFEHAQQVLRKNRKH